MSPRARIARAACEERSDCEGAEGRSPRSRSPELAGTPEPYRALARGKAQGYAAPMKASDIKTIAVVGAGQMGSGIAQVCAAKGFTVLLSDASIELRQAGQRERSPDPGQAGREGQGKADDKDALVGRIKPVASRRSFDTAISSSRPRPRTSTSSSKLFRRLDSTMKPGRHPRIEHVEHLASRVSRA